MNIRLREVEASDLPLFFEHQRDPVAVEMVAFTSRDRPAFEQHWAKVLGGPANVVRTIVVASAASAESAPSEHVAGHICSFTRDGLREIGYWIERGYWGRGLATGALAAFLRLEETRPLYAGVAKHNAASLRVLQKCGFTFLPASDAPSGDEDTHDLLVLSAADGTRQPDSEEE